MSGGLQRRSRAPAEPAGQAVACRDPWPFDDVVGDSGEQDGDRQDDGRQDRELERGPPASQGGDRRRRVGRRHVCVQAQQGHGKTDHHEMGQVATEADTTDVADQAVVEQRDGL